MSSFFLKINFYSCKVFLYFYLNLNHNNTMLVTRTSPFTGITRTLDLNITAGEVAAYSRGALLQNAFPNLNAGEREFFKTGITDEEWEKHIGGDE